MSAERHEFPASVSDYRIHMSVHKDTVNDEEVQRKSDMHSWGEATAGLCKHGPCGGNDHPVRGHCLPLTLLFGQDSNNHTDLSPFKQVPPRTTRLRPTFVRYYHVMKQFLSPRCLNI